MGSRMEGLPRSARGDTSADIRGAQGVEVVQTFTARYVKIESGYLGQLVEWPEVVTEGATIEECRAMVRDALHEMILAYRQQGKEVPAGNDLFEQVSVELDHVRQTA